MPSSSGPVWGASNNASEYSAKGKNLEQVYFRIGDQHEQLLAKINLPLLDSSASIDLDGLFRLALVTCFQFAELLPDPSAEEASMHRKDWKYALHLPLKYPGVSGFALRSFHETLNSSSKGLHEFDELIKNLDEIGLFILSKNELNARNLLNAVCMINRFYSLNQAVKAALSFLVSAQPDWVRANALPHWYMRFKTGRLNLPGTLSLEEMNEEAVRLGKDIYHILTALHQQQITCLANHVEIQQIARLFAEQFIVNADQITWRQSGSDTHSKSFRGEYEI